MSNEALENPSGDSVVELIAEPVVETPVEPEVKRYSYQPTDEQGRPIGAKQVIKYTTSDELAEKLAEQNTLLVRKLRSETRKNRLGIVETDNIPQERPRFQEPVGFNPKHLSADDQYELARKLGVDPEQFDTVTDELFEVKMGVKPAELRRIFMELQEDRVNRDALNESNRFMAANPAYIKCQENSEAIVSWMVKNELAPVQANYQLAYDTLLGAGVLIETVEDIPEEPMPPPEPEIIPDPLPTPEPIIEPVVPPEPTPVEFKPARIPSGFTRETSTDSGPAPSFGDDIVYEVVTGNTKRRYTGLAAINAMPSDELKHRVNTIRGFSEKVEKMEREAYERRRNKQRQ